MNKYYKKILYFIQLFGLLLITFVPLGFVRAHTNSNYSAGNSKNGYNEIYTNNVSWSSYFGDYSYQNYPYSYSNYNYQNYAYPIYLSQTNLSLMQGQSV